MPVTLLLESSGGPSIVALFRRTCDRFESFAFYSALIIDTSPRARSSDYLPELILSSLGKSVASRSWLCITSPTGTWDETRVVRCQV